MILALAGYSWISVEMAARKKGCVFEIVGMRRNPSFINVVGPDNPWRYGRLELGM